MESTSDTHTRKIRAPNRYKPDGTYYKGPNDPNYFNNYYHTKLAHHEECIYCNTSIKKSYMHKHQQTQKCRAIYENMSMLLLQLPALGEESTTHMRDADDNVL